MSGPFATKEPFIDTDYVIAHSTSGQTGVSMHCVCV